MDVKKRNLFGEHMSFKPESILLLDANRYLDLYRMPQLKNKNIDVVSALDSLGQVSQSKDEVLKGVDVPFSRAVSPS